VGDATSGPVRLSFNSQLRVEFRPPGNIVPAISADPFRKLRRRLQDRIDGSSPGGYGVFGSAKFNLAFCRPGAAVVCVILSGYAAQNAGVVIMTRHLCHALGLKLAFYEVEIAGRHPTVLNSNIVISEADATHMIGPHDDMASHAG
jgi:hypothetical protein